MSRRHSLVAGIAIVVVLPLALLVGVGWDPLADADRAADLDAHTVVTGHASVLAWMRALTHLGDPLVVTAAAGLAAAVCWVANRRRAAVYLLAVRVVSVIVGSVLKEVVGRARPILPQPVAHASGLSFPSGHALGSAATYLSLALVATRVRPEVTLAVVPLAVVIALVVGATRVMLGVHFPSDVVAGLVLGWAIALLGRPRTSAPVRTN